MEIPHVMRVLCFHVVQSFQGHGAVGVDDLADDGQMVSEITRLR
jgi:hypothetical protein